MKLSEGPPSNRNTPTTDAKKIREKSQYFGVGPGLIFTQRIFNMLVLTKKSNCHCHLECKKYISSYFIYKIVCYI